MGEGVTDAGRPGIAVRDRPEGRLFVIGIDGLAPFIIDTMIEQGELPVFGRLQAEGCYGPLRTISPTNSSLLWTTIATGRHHRDHGVDHFRYYRLFGRRYSHFDLRKGPWVTKRLLRTARMLGFLRTTLFDNRHVREMPFWEVASHAGLRAGVVNWWHTWPAPPTDGFVVSDRLLYWRNLGDRDSSRLRSRLTYPEKLAQELRPLRCRPEDLTIGDLQRYVRLPEKELRRFTEAEYRANSLRGELHFFVAADRSCERFLDHSLDTYDDADLVAAYFRSPDLAQHCAFQHSAWAQERHSTPEEREQFGNVVVETYRDMDLMLGRLMERMGPEDGLIVVSDHGFTFVDERRGYCHRYGEPPGVIFAWGPQFREGAPIEAADVYDVAPTVVRLLGLPASQQFEGHCLEQVLAPRFIEEHPARVPVPGYGPRRPIRSGIRTPPGIEKEILEHLRGLGYLK